MNLRAREPLSTAAVAVLAGGTVLAAAAALLVVGWAQSARPDAGATDRLDAFVSLGHTLDFCVEVFRGAFTFALHGLPWRAVGVFVLWLAGLAGVGSWIVSRLLPPGVAPDEKAVFSFAAGFLAVGLVVFVGGLTGLARPVAMWAVLGASALFAVAQWRCLFALFRELPPPMRRPLRQHATRNVLSIAVLVLVAIGFLYAITPPIQSDGMRYHLAAPQEFLKAGRIVYLPLNAFSNFPFLPEMHFMVALGTGAPEAAQLMHFATMLVAALGVGAFSRRFVSPLIDSGRNVRWPAVARLLPLLGYLGIPASFVVGSWPFIDHAVCLYFFLSVYALLVAFERCDWRPYCLAGMMMGGALGSKYTALAFLAIPGAIALVEWIAFSPPARAGVRRTVRFRNLVLCALVCLATGGAWYAKNTVFAGNPVYPLATGVFAGGEFGTDNARLYRDKMNEKGLPKTPANLTHAPWDATFQWTRYERHFPGAMLLVVFVAGVAGCVVLLPGVFGAARPVLYAATAALGYGGLWFMTYQSNRMIMPAVALMLPAVAAFLLFCATASRLLYAVAAGAVLVAFVHGGLWSVQYETGISQPPMRYYLRGGMSREMYLDRALNYQPAFRRLNDRVRPGEKVLLLGEHRIYGARFDAAWSDWFDTPAVLALMRRLKPPDAQAFAEALRGEGVRWILVNDAELGPQMETYWKPRFDVAEWKLLNDLLASPAFDRETLPPGVRILHLKGEQR